jgi:coatomer protein complex subunit epsilon
LGRVALIVQIHLQQNRTDLALKEAQAARRWAQDSLLVNLAESWVGLRVVYPKFSISSGIDLVLSSVISLLPFMFSW